MIFFGNTKEIVFCSPGEKLTIFQIFDKYILVSNSIKLFVNINIDVAIRTATDCILELDERICEVPQIDFKITHAATKIS